MQKKSHHLSLFNFPVHIKHFITVLKGASQINAYKQSSTLDTILYSLSNKHTLTRYASIKVYVLYYFVYLYLLVQNSLSLWFTDSMYI